MNRSTFILQIKTEAQEWIDAEETPVQVKALRLFDLWKKKIPKNRQIRLIKRTEELLGIRD